MKVKLKAQEIILYAFKTAEHGNIKFGIEAPSSVAINREEVYMKNKAKNATE